MNENIFEQVEKMTDAEKQAALSAEIPEEIQKEAAAELDSAVLADALYSYGWLNAERAIAEVDGLDKVAADALAAHEQAEAEAAQAIESSLESLGSHLTEDVVELHKEAQAAAALIFNGYSDCLEKNAKAGAGHLEKVKGAMKAGYKKLKGAAKSGGRMAYKHRGKAAAMGAAAGTYMAAKHLDKHASDEQLSVEQMIDIASEVALEKAVFEAEVGQGIDNLEKVATAKAGKLKELMGAAKKHGKSALKHGLLHRGKLGLAGGAAAGLAAHHATKKD